MFKAGRRCCGGPRSCSTPPTSVSCARGGTVPSLSSPLRREGDAYPSPAHPKPSRGRGRTRCRPTVNLNVVQRQSFALVLLGRRWSERRLRIRRQGPTVSAHRLKPFSERHGSRACRAGPGARLRRRRLGATAGGRTRGRADAGRRALPGQEHDAVSPQRSVPAMSPRRRGRVSAVSVSRRPPSPSGTGIDRDPRRRSPSVDARAPQPRPSQRRHTAASPAPPSAASAPSPPPAAAAPLAPSAGGFRVQLPTRAGFRVRQPTQSRRLPSPAAACF